ncbi:MAG: penicillin acylase family protein [Terriglobales bacterium]
MPTTAALSAPPRHRGWRLLGEVIAALVLLAAAMLGFLYVYVRGVQPQLDGRLALAGLQAPATIVRDRWGIAHIQAASIHDLFLAQGFAMAQDRLWQMDLMRRLAEGRLAAIFGPEALPLDKQNRELGLGRMARRNARHLEPGEAALLEAFAEGVNDYIGRRQNHLPLSFQLLHYRPQAWQPSDTLAVAAYMYQTLASDYKDKLIRETFLAKLGPILGAELFPDQSPWDVPPGAPPPQAPAQLLPASQNRMRPPLQVFVAPSQRSQQRGGSNNWVLAGWRSSTGLPLLANDPHLEFQIPGLWWTASLRSPQLHVAGVAIAGVPGIVIGHNDQIAWGVTNGDADVQDLYRAKLDGKGNVLTPTGWIKLRHWHEVIRVKNQAAVRLDIAVTPHGPIIAHDAGGPLALAWSMYAPGALREMHVFLEIDEAQNWQEFEQALAGFAGPAQNFVYADRAGHIGYQLAGWVPVRRGFEGSVPVPGDQAGYEWQGWIPFSRLPRALDPSSGILATANGRITPNGYRYVISTDWDAPNRTRRIYALLQARERWTPAALGSVQTDAVSEQDRDFAAALVAAGRAAETGGGGLSPRLRQAVNLLRGFRGAMNHESAAPTLAYFTRQELLQEVLAAKVGAAQARDYKWSEAPVFEQWLVRQQPPQWLPHGYADWNALLLHCLSQVVQRITLRPGTAHWGHDQRLSLLHPVFSQVPFARGWADLGPVEIDGSPLTIKQARNPSLGDKVELGPSMRFIADPADWDQSTLTLVAGESGLPFNRHYRDQFSAYLAGRGLPLWFSAQAVAMDAVHSLRLEPAASRRTNP